MTTDINTLLFQMEAHGMKGLAAPELDDLLSIVFKNTQEKWITWMRIPTRNNYQFSLQHPAILNCEIYIQPLQFLSNSVTNIVLEIVFIFNMV